MGDLIEELEMLVGVVGRHMGELGSAGAGPGIGLGLWEDVNGAGDDSDVGKGESGRNGRMG